MRMEKRVGGVCTHPHTHTHYGIQQNKRVF
jgi:hypothetical protein